MNSIGYGIAAAFFTASARVLFRSLMRDNGRPIPLLIYYNLVAGLLIGTWYWPFELPTISTEIALLLAGGTISWCIAGYFDLRSAAHLDASVSAILASLRYALLVVGSSILLGEVPSALAAAGSLLIVLSVIISADLSNAHFRAGAVFRLISIVLINIGIICDKKLTNHLSAGFISSWSFLVPGLVVMIFNVREAAAIPSELKRLGMKAVFSPFFVGGTYLFFVLSFASGTLLLASTLQQTSTILTWLFAVVILKERTDLGRRLFASILCVIGATLVSLA